MKMIDSENLILASASPRRRALLEKLGLQFTIIPSRVKEEAFSHPEPTHYVRALAAAKAGEIADLHPSSWVIGADSAVVVDDRVLGKPSSLEDARNMMHRLSGKTHRVYTGISVICRQCRHSHTDAAATEVDFKILSEAEIEWYIRTGEPYDKAGGYGIQGIGSFMVRQIRGSYTNVVGLPVCMLFDHLLAHNVVRLGTGSGQTMHFPGENG